MRNLLTLCTVLFLFASCSRNKDDDNPLPVAAAMVYQASARTTSADMYLEPNKLNNSAMPYGSTVGYFDAIPGNRMFRVNRNGTGETLLRENIQFGVNRRYSIFFADQSTSFVKFVVEDDFPNAQAGKAFIRFFHLANGLAAVDVNYLVGSAYQPIFPNRPFETQATAENYDNFIPIDAGSHSFQVRLSPGGVVQLTQANVQLAEGKAYTLFISGDVPTHPVTLKVVTNR
ncbi:DUF4397 domain-containing protein [Chitinophaga caseinilytica]|uniref:DUF4397 domain-containing protein n=1 Tax=Chitinophaga caseinilytica TaxID=2267521 RepID=A0ABZ2Z7W6_9BACT